MHAALKSKRSANLTLNRTNCFTLRSVSMVSETATRPSTASPTESCARFSHNAIALFIQMIDGLSSSNRSDQGVDVGCKTVCGGASCQETCGMTTENVGKLSEEGIDYWFATPKISARLLICAPYTALMQPLPIPVEHARTIRMLDLKPVLVLDSRRSL